MKWTHVSILSIGPEPRNAFCLNLIIATTLKRLSAVAFVIIGIVKDASCVNVQKKSHWLVMDKLLLNLYGDVTYWDEVWS